MYDDYINYYGFPRELGFIRRKQLSRRSRLARATPREATRPGQSSRLGQLQRRPADASSASAPPWMDLDWPGLRLALPVGARKAA